MIVIKKTWWRRWNWSSLLTTTLENIFVVTSTFAIVMMLKRFIKNMRLMRQNENLTGLFLNQRGIFARGEQVIAVNLFTFHSRLTFRGKIGISQARPVETIHVKVEMSGKLLTALFSREGHKSRLSIAQFWIWPWPWGPSQAYFFTNNKQIVIKVLFWNKEILVFSIIDCVSHPLDAS